MPMSIGPESQSRSCAWKRETGLTLNQACALVAAVAAYETDGMPVWRRCVSDMVARTEDGPDSAGDDLLPLLRMGLLTDAGRMGNDALYRVTSHAVARVREWAGRTVSAEAAE
jgi:hypothetical protein